LASTINQLIRERKNVYRELKRAMRRLDSYQEEAERMINRVLARKRSVPDVEDYSELIQKVAEVGSAHNSLQHLLEQYSDVFT